MNYALLHSGYCNSLTTEISIMESINRIDPNPTTTNPLKSFSASSTSYSTIDGNVVTEKYEGRKTHCYTGEYTTDGSN